MLWGGVVGIREGRPFCRGADCHSKKRKYFPEKVIFQNQRPSWAKRNNFTRIFTSYIISQDFDYNTCIRERHFTCHDSQRFFPLSSLWNLGSWSGWRMWGYNKPAKRSKTFSVSPRSCWFHRFIQKPLVWLSLRPSYEVFRSCLQAFVVWQRRIPFHRHKLETFQLSLIPEPQSQLDIFRNFDFYRKTWVCTGSGCIISWHFMAS